ncbi:MAG: hypothetical protein KDK23_12930 [Leptospiraceae bacterium]|nr:hypothetical protein [Leptospiraceae bacterium]
MFEQLLNSTDDMLGQLEELISSLDEESFCRPLDVLQKASVGEHLRHSLEFFVAYLGGLQAGEVCYDRRKRDPRLQTEPDFAIETIGEIREGLRKIDPENGDESINLDVEWLEGPGPIRSTLARELHYIQDHLLHHSALIKVGIFHGLENPTVRQIRDMEKFGVAPSTLAYQASAGN